jgi:hypothetical protein
MNKGMRNRSISMPLSYLHRYDEARGVKSIVSIYDIFFSQKLLYFLFLPFIFFLSFLMLEKAASSRRDRLFKSTSSNLKLNHTNIAKAAKQHPRTMHWPCPKYSKHFVLPTYANREVPSFFLVRIEICGSSRAAECGVLELEFHVACFC